MKPNIKPYPNGVFFGEDSRCNPFFFVVVKHAMKVIVHVKTQIALADGETESKDLVNVSLSSASHFGHTLRTEFDAFAFAGPFGS